MIKYLGSKRLLVDDISRLCGLLAPEGAEVLDLFSGTARVGRALRQAGFTVTSNDWNAYAATLARCYLQGDLATHGSEVQGWIDRLQAAPDRDGYATQTWCRDSRFFQEVNGRRIDGIRHALQELDPPEPLRSILLTSLMEAADRVDSTTGVQMAYLKNWAQRSHNALTLRIPRMLADPAPAGTVWQMDARDAAARFTGSIAYLDPPYNQHKYVGNYHIWETLVRWDAPEVYGKACKRVACKTQKSVFNSKRHIRAGMQHVTDALDVDTLVVSFSNEGHLTLQDLVQILQTRGEVSAWARGYERYVGAKIGIHGPKGDKVGAVSHTRNLEYLFVAGRQPDPDGIQAALGDDWAPVSPTP